MAWRAEQTPRLTVLTWHNVEPTWCFPARPGCGRRGLDTQLRFCRRYLNVVSLSMGVRALREGTRLPPRAVALTFDDGYRDVLRVVPLLAALRLPATFFLVPGLLSGRTMPWWETVAWTLLRARPGDITFHGLNVSLRTAARRRRAARTVSELLKRLPAQERFPMLNELADRCEPAGSPPGSELFLDWADAGELVRRGFEVGSHSMAHDILANEPAPDQFHDLARSRQELEQRLQTPVELLAYPNGKPDDYDHITVSAAASAGYAGSFTTVGGRNRPETPQHELRRFVLNPDRGLAAFPLLASQR